MKSVLGWTIVTLSLALLGVTALGAPLYRLDFDQAVAGNPTPVVLPWQASIPLPRAEHGVPGQ